MQHALEVAQGERFEFGANWSKFLALLNEARIEQAKKSLQEMLGLRSLEGKSFIDIGSGSGLFSLAARMLGAKVHSFDYDPKSVACTKALKQRFFPNDVNWTIEEGSALDPAYLSSLGQFDIVYSWGVLHHTGRMWDALEYVTPLVKSGGKLFIALYNDQGRPSRTWLKVKKAYNKLGALNFLVLWPAFIRLWGPTFIRELLTGKPFHSWRNYTGLRGMNPWRDVVDWVGGYPFEVASPEQIFKFYAAKGFTLTNLVTCSGGLGCNEFVFDRR